MKSSFLRHAFWLGPLLTFAGFVSYYLIFAKYPALRDFPWINLPLVTIGAGLAVTGLGATWKGAGWMRRLLHLGGTLFSLGVAGLLYFYVFYLSYQMPAASQETVTLVEAPDFTLTDAGGNVVSLSDYRGKRVVLAFYRGFW